MLAARDDGCPPHTWPGWDRMHLAGGGSAQRAPARSVRALSIPPPCFPTGRSPDSLPLVSEHWHHDPAAKVPHWHHETHHPLFKLSSGLDLAWPKMLGYPKDRVAVIDAVCMFHPAYQAPSRKRVYSNPHPRGWCAAWVAAGWAKGDAGRRVERWCCNRLELCLTPPWLLWGRQLGQGAKLGWTCDRLGTTPVTSSAPSSIHSSTSSLPTAMSCPTLAKPPFPKTTCRSAKDEEREMVRRFGVTWAARNAAGISGKQELHVWSSIPEPQFRAEFQTEQCRAGADVLPSRIRGGETETMQPSALAAQGLLAIQLLIDVIAVWLALRRWAGPGWQATVSLAEKAAGLRPGWTGWRRLAAGE